jgi:SAM-dependent methyltransferase
MDPLAGSSWSEPGTIEGFVRAFPNEVLMRFAEHVRGRPGTGRALDIGCGAARNAVPLAGLGWDVAGTDLSWPMLTAAAQRARAEHVADRVHPILAPMDRIPFAGQTFDLVIAHGIWNLARSGGEFRRAVREAARVARPGSALFVFTFSRSTFPEDAEPVAGESFVFTQFSGQPQCFLTEAQLIAELGAAGFEPDPDLPTTEYNRRLPGSVPGSAPAIYECAFRRTVRPGEPA